MALANLSIDYTWKNIKSEYNNNKFKISAPTWNDTFDLPYYCFLFNFWHSRLLWVIIKKHKTLTENSPFQIYVNQIETGIVFKIKTGHKLELLSPETMKPFGSTKKMLITTKMEIMHQT